MPSYDISVDSSTIDVTSLQPSARMVAHVASCLFRHGKCEKPGFVIIRQCRSLLSSKRRVEAFQQSLIDSLRRHIETAYPSILTSHEWLDAPRNQVAKLYSENHPTIVTTRLSGYHTHTAFHFDALTAVLSSVCYSHRRNISGGHPRFLDLLKMKQDRGYKSIRHMITIEKYGATIPDDYGRAVKGLYYASPRKWVMDKAGPYIKTIRDLDYNEFPIIVFSNLPSDGIMHGASRVSKRDVDTPAARSLHHVALGVDVFC